PTVNLPYPIYPPNSSNSGNSSNVNLQNPLNFSDSVVYDPTNGTYNFNYQVGNSIPYQPSSSMTLEEYLDYDMEKALQKGWQDLSEEYGKKPGGADIPFLKPKAEGGMFGSDFIDIKPSGTAELRFGINTSKSANTGKATEDHCIRF
ncbi:MAG TPA: hypothetical protein PK637_08080, partial [Flavobacteriales bacterium]|nr:hypothetical protein [Flavobacteriales bacterium]